LSNENLIFWSAYHKVLEISENSKKDWNILSLKQIQDLFLEEMKKYDLMHEELERLKERWLNWLGWYYDIFSKNPREVLNLEYNFRAKDILFDWVPLTWKIDKIEIIWQTDNSEEQEWQQALFKEKVALIDFKTWTIKKILDIKWIYKDWRKKESGWDYYRQLLFYKLMFENCSELNSNYEVGELALDFVEWKNWEYKYVWVDYNREDFEEFKILLKDSWEKINDINFWKEILKK
jgi:hypothetical protein